VTNQLEDPQIYATLGVPNIYKTKLSQPTLLHLPAYNFIMAKGTFLCNKMVIDFSPIFFKDSISTQKYYSPNFELRYLKSRWFAIYNAIVGIN